MRKLILPILILAIAIVVVIFVAKDDGDSQSPAPVAQESIPKPEIGTPTPIPPRIERIEPPVEPVVLPVLNESDEEILVAASETVGSPMVEALLVQSGIIRKIVVTIDNAPRDKIAMRVRAVNATPGRFQVAGEEGAYALSEDNFARYDNMVGWVAAVDAARLVDVYQRYYPLLQEAYQELGYPDREFNTRVIEVIDDFLAAPEIDGPIPLVRPHVLYKYAHPDLEGRSAGQRALVRMGNRNAGVVKAKLREIRKEIVARSD